MMSSASPSGTSSHATQTGRPSLWTESDQRKLTRLYVYTTLPLKKILNVLHASHPDDEAPGKDSANKKLNSMLDKEPRWLHPRTRTDMDRRISELSHSPTRHVSPDADIARQHAPSVSSRGSAAREIKDELGNSPSVHEIQGLDAGTAPGSWNMASRPLPAVVTHLEPPRVLFAGVSEPVPPDHPRFATAILRRATAMTTSTQMTTTTLQEALSGYSIEFVRSVKKVIKRYTMPVTTDADDSPVSDSHTGSVRSTHDESALPAWEATRPLPGDFLNIDVLLEEQGVCIDGLPEHTTRACLCHVLEELTGDHWVSHEGPAPHVHSILQAPHRPDINLDARDPFGNTVLHLLAARGVAPQHLLGCVHRCPDPAATNTAGQTFLHVLGPTWFADLARPDAPLYQLLHALQALGFDIYARDIYGRTIFHVLRTKDLDAATFNCALQNFHPPSYGRRDALGTVPQPMQAWGFRRAQTGLAQPSRSSGGTLSRPHTDPLVKQADLLRMVEKSRTEPRAEDSHGRNGLHCLAAAILSPNTLLTKYGNGAPVDRQASNRKRKRDAPAAQSSDPAIEQRLPDSSKERLTLREMCVHNLIASGVDVNHYDASGNTVLMAFVAHLPEDDDYKVPVSILELLISHGADIHARNRAGETALHVAVRHGRKLATRTLALRGANVHVRDGAGRSVLDVVDAKMRTERNEKMYSHYEACRGWLSGVGRAVQTPTVHQEWGLGR